MSDACWAAGVPLLRVRIVGGALELGPYVDPAATACLECLDVEEDVRAEDRWGSWRWRWPPRSSPMTCSRS
ncbi:MAG: hypothetical protein R2734_09765 [Nocardioides sp.]